MDEQLQELMLNTNMLHFEGDSYYIDRILECVEDIEDTAGFVDNQDALYERYTVEKYLGFFGELLGAKKLLPAVISYMHLTESLKKKTIQCTAGEKRRVAVARELLKDAQAYVLLNPMEELDEDSQKIILNWMETFGENGKRLVTLSQSHRYTCLCPGNHYEIRKEEIACIDWNEVTEENPDLPAINKISVTYNDKTFLFNPEEIDYVEANDGKVYVYVQKERYTGGYKMSELEERLTKFGFFRCHRSYIVNMQKVVELVKWTRNSYSLKLAKYEKTDIPLSKAKIQELKSMYEF